ncbi:MAG: Rhs element Vgr protein, partial [Bacteroidota bacterium]
MASRVIPTQGATDLPTFKVFSDGEEIGGLFGILSVYVSKRVNKIPTARIILSDGDVSKEDFEVSNGDHFVPGKEIEIHAGYHNTEDPIFKGIVIKHGIKTQKDKTSVLILDLRDATVKMTIGRKNSYFQEVTDSDVIEELIGAYSLDSEVEATDVEHLELVQYHATDWDFMVSRAEANGQLVFVDDGKVTVQKPDPSQEPLIELAFGHNVFEFEAGIDARDQYAATTSTAWDYSAQEVLEEEGADPGFEEQGNLSASDLADVIGLETWPQQHGGKVTDQELKQWSDAKLLRSRLAKVQGNIKMV